MKLIDMIVDDFSRVISHIITLKQILNPQIKTTIVNGYFFEVSSFLFFIGPLFVISLLYIRIGMKLKSSNLFEGCVQHSDTEYRNTTVKAQTRVVRMLSKT